MAGLVDTVIAYRFVKILSTPWTKQAAFKLGIIDENGKVLKKRSSIQTGEEKVAYTIIHQLVWNIKRLIAKVPGGKSRFGSFAAAIWLLKEELESNKTVDASFLEETFIDHLQKTHQLHIIKESLDGVEQPTVLYPGKYKASGQTFFIKENLNTVGECLGCSLFRPIPNSREVISYEDISRIA